MEIDLEKYKDYVSKRDYKYFLEFGIEDRRDVINAAKEKFQLKNMDMIRDKLSSHDIKLLEILSHELRTSLNGITGVVDLMQSDIMTDDQLLYINTLSQSTNYLLAIINRLQDFFTLQTETSIIDLVSFDIHTVIKEISESLKQYQNIPFESINIIINIEPNIPLFVKGDINKIQQIFTNLLLIAISLSDNKSVNINTKCKNILDDEITLNIEIGSNNVKSIINIEDNIDLSVSLEDMLTDKTYNKSSIGLIICREFINLLGSKLDIYVKENVLKIKFDLTLKRIFESPIVQFEKIDSSMFKILIVEDNIINQKILKIMLSKLGFISDVVDNGKEAIINMETQLYDLILMDCEMPIMNGYDTTQYIRNKLNNNVIIIAITANNTISAKQRCKKVGMNDYFTKPLTINNLSKIINKWLNIRK